MTTPHRSVEERNALVLCNLPLVSAIAKDFKSLAHMLSLDPEDFDQEGTLGLIVAAEKWDPIQFPAIRFEWFAGCWIRSLLRQLVRRERHQAKTGASSDVALMMSDGPFGSQPFPLDITVPLMPRIVRGRIVWIALDLDFLKPPEKPHATRKIRPARPAP